MLVDSEYDDTFAYHSHPFDPWSMWRIRGWGLGEAPASLFPAGNAYSPTQLAAIYRQTVTPGQVSEVEFVAQAKAAGISDQFLVEARNILLGRPPGTAWDGTPPDQAPRSGFTLAEKVAALRKVLQDDPRASYQDIVATAAAYGIREPEVREAYAELLRERQASATPTTTSTPATTSTPITAYLPPGWTQGPGTSALDPRPVVTTTVAPSVPTTFRDLEATGYATPIPPSEGGGVVGDMPPAEGRARLGVPLPLLAAGAAVAAFLLTRR